MSAATAFPDTRRVSGRSLRRPRFLICGALLMSLSIAAMGFATSFWQILVLAMLSGTGNSVIHPADYAIISGSVDKDRMGRAFALHTFSGNLGFSSAPPVIALLTVAIGWRASLIAGRAAWRAGGVFHRVAELDTERPGPARGDQAAPNCPAGTC